MEKLNVSNVTNSSTATNETNKVYNKLSGVPLFLSVYTIILTFAIVGNLLVCWIVKRNKKLHDITNYLLVNLAVSDLIQSFSTIFQVLDFVIKDLNLGNAGCKFQINMLNIPYGTSVLTLVFIAYERHYIICKPMQIQDVKKRIRWIIPSIWLMSIVIYFPTLLYCGARLDKENNQLSCDCKIRWPSLRAKNIYGIGLVMVLYAVPLIVLIGFYSQVIRRLRRPIPGEVRGTDTTYQSRKGVVKMLLVTMVMFFVSWTPYNVLYLMKRLEIDYRSIYPFVWYPAVLLAFLSCAYNPVIYCLLSKNFREGFKSALCCWRPFGFSRNTASASSSSTPSSRSTRRRVLDDPV